MNNGILEVGAGLDYMIYLFSVSTFLYLPYGAVLFLVCLCTNYTYYYHYYCYYLLLLTVHGYGVRELHILLMIRMQEPYIMDPIIIKVLDGFDDLAGIRRVHDNESLHDCRGAADDAEEEEKTERQSFFAISSSPDDSSSSSGGRGGAAAADRARDTLPSHSAASRRYTSSRSASNRLQGSSRRPTRTLAPRRWHFSSQFPFITRDESYNGNSGSTQSSRGGQQSYYGSFYEESGGDNGSGRNDEIDPFLTVNNNDD